MSKKYGVPAFIRKQEHQKYLASNASTTISISKEDYEALNNELKRRGLLPLI